MFNLEDIGLTQEKLQDRVVESISASILGRRAGTLDSDECFYTNKLETKVTKQIEQKISEKIDKIGNDLIEPSIESIIEKITYVPTNNWGEKKGEPFTLKEYLLQQTKEYLTQEVNAEGKTRGTSNYSWNSVGTRLSYIIKSHIGDEVKLEIKRLMQEAFDSLGVVLAESIQQHVKEIQNKIKKG